jgi:hypothetical protein
MDDFERPAVPGCDVDGDRVFKIPDPLCGFVAFMLFCGISSHRDYWDTWWKVLSIVKELHHPGIVELWMDNST